MISSSGCLHIQLQVRPVSILCIHMCTSVVLYRYILCEGSNMDRSFVT